MGPGSPKPLPRQVFAQSVVDVDMGGRRQWGEPRLPVPSRGDHGADADRSLAARSGSVLRVGADADFPMLCRLAIAGNARSRGAATCGSGRRPRGSHARPPAGDAGGRNPLPGRSGTPGAAGSSKRSWRRPRRGRPPERSGPPRKRRSAAPGLPAWCRRRRPRASTIGVSSIEEKHHEHRTQWHRHRRRLPADRRQGAVSDPDRRDLTAVTTRRPGLRRPVLDPRTRAQSSHRSQAGVDR